MTMINAYCVIEILNNTLYNIIDLTQNLLVYEFFRKRQDLLAARKIVLNSGFLIENSHKRKDFQV